MTHEQLWSLAAELQGRPVPGVRMSESEFEAWCDEDVRAEWVDGEVILMPPSSTEHDDLLVWFISLVKEFVDRQALGSIQTNVLTRLPGLRRSRVPDLMFISRQQQDRLHATRFDGAPDLIIEFVSIDSESRDRRDKFQEYEKAGVREYWIVDPLTRTVEVYALENKRFALLPQPRGIASSRVLSGLRIRVADLWARPLPRILTTLQRMKRWR